MEKIKVSELEALCAQPYGGRLTQGGWDALGALLRLARAAKAEDTQRTKILAGELKFPRDTEQCDATLRELYEALSAFDFTD